MVLIERISSPEKWRFVFWSQKQNINSHKYTLKIHKTQTHFRTQKNISTHAQTKFKHKMKNRTPTQKNNSTHSQSQENLNTYSKNKNFHIRWTRTQISLTLLFPWMIISQKSDILLIFWSELQYCKTFFVFYVPLLSSGLSCIWGNILYMLLCI